MGYFSSLGIPSVFGLLAILAEFFGAIALLLGLFGRVAAVGVGAVMSTAAVTVHLSNGFFMNWFGNQQGEGVEYFVLCAAIALWNTVYVERAVEELRDRGHEITDEHLKHLSPLGWEHIALTGVYRWDLRGAPQQGVLRPLRS